jgi:hypothetical protein
VHIKAVHIALHQPVLYTHRPSSNSIIPRKDCSLHCYLFFFLSLISNEQEIFTGHQFLQLRKEKKFIPAMTAVL